MIEVTQEKPIGNSNCNILENISGVSNNQHISGLPPNDTSKRRTKIFDKSPNRSVSPNNQVLSPTAKIPPQPPSHQTQSLARPVVPSNQEKNKVFFYSKYS